MSDIQQRIAGPVSLPPGYRIEYGGQFESEAQTSRQLAFLSLGVIAGILLILTTAFRSYKDAFIIMLNLPRALIIRKYH